MARLLIMLAWLMVTACHRPPLEPLRTAAMYPTLGTTSRCRVDRRPFTPERGHVVIVAIEGQPVVRRVVGVGGDTVAVVDGAVILNGEPVPTEVHRARTGCRVSVSARCQCAITEEEHGARIAMVQRLLPELSRDFRCDRGATPPEVTVPDGAYYVLADNRDAATDSRHVGVVTEILGRVMSCR